MKERLQATILLSSVTAGLSESLTAPQRTVWFHRVIKHTEWVLLNHWLSNRREVIGPWLMYWVTNLKVMSSRSTDKPLSCVLWPKEVMSTIHLIYLKSTDSYQSRVSTSIGCLKNKTKKKKTVFALSMKLLIPGGVFFSCFFYLSLFKHRHTTGDVKSLVFKSEKSVFFLTSWVEPEVMKLLPWFKPYVTCLGFTPLWNNECTF